MTADELFPNYSPPPSVALLGIVFQAFPITPEEQALAQERIAALAAEINQRFAEGDAAQQIAVLKDQIPKTRAQLQQLEGRVLGFDRQIEEAILAGRDPRSLEKQQAEARAESTAAKERLQRMESSLSHITQEMYKERNAADAAAMRERGKEVRQAIRRMAPALLADLEPHVRKVLHEYALLTVEEFYLRTSGY